MNILITGINGFVGKHLTKELVNFGHQVYGIGTEDLPNQQIESLIADYQSADLSRKFPPSSHRIDAIIHLAGLAAVGPSFDQPQAYISINSAIFTNICEYYLGKNEDPRILVVSSASIYDPHQPMPIDETSPVVFTSPYSVSKVLLENQAQYYNSRGMHCTVVRPFNHIGPEQGLGFLIPDLTDRIIKSDNGSNEITVGNLTTKRDYTDVRDVVRAYRLIIAADKLPNHFLYNVCSGVSYSGEEILNYIVHLLKIKMPSIIVEQSLIRPNDIPEIRGNNLRLVNEYNWQPKYTIKQTIRDYLASR
ncbi:GDP-mannose 4,6-dehydratase [Candidatus Nomurabacteria bacterium]|nr:GDP-mannose 4,6-dehydratase [Candidatus Nomurabacteria bacterium]